MPDRIYSVSYGGRIYDVRAADNANPSDIFAFVAQQAGAEAKPPEQEKSPIENIPLVGGALASVADIPLSFGQGLAGIGKTFTDVFGAGNQASDFLAEVNRLAGEWKSAGSKEDAAAAARIQKEAEGKGIWEEVKAAVSALSYSPIETTAQLAGSAVPFVAAALAAPGTGGTSLIPAAAALGLGAVSGAGMLKGDIYDAVYKRSLEAGVSEEKAREIADQAQAYGGENLDQIALGGAIGAVANATGLPKQIAGLIGRRVAEDVVERGLLRSIGRGAVVEGVPEGVQAGQERFAQNLAEQRAGYETDLWKGVAGQAAFEGLAGAIGGGALGPFEGGERPASERDAEFNANRAAFEETVTDETLSPEARAQAVDAYAANLAAVYFGDEKFAREIAEAELQRIEDVRARAAQAKADKEALDAAAAGLEEPAPERGEPDISGAGEPVAEAGPAVAPAGVEPSTVGAPVDLVGEPARSAAAGEPALAPITSAQVKATVSTIEKAFEDNAIDFEDAYGVTKLNAEQKKQAARIILQSPEVDPYNAIGSVLDRGVRIRGETPPARPAPRAAAPADLDAQIDEYTAYAERGEFAPQPLVDAIASQYIDAAAAGVGADVVSPERIPAFQQFISNEYSAIERAQRAAREVPPTVAETATIKPEAPKAEPAPEAAVEVAPEVQELQEFIDRVNPGFEARYAPGTAKPFRYGIPGQKKNLGSTTSIEGLKRQIRQTPKLGPKKVIEGVEVDVYPEAPRKQGLGARQDTAYQMSRDAVAPEDKAGKVTQALQEQIDLLNQDIDAARRNREISDNERAELVQMLQRPTNPAALARDKIWTLEKAFQDRLQKTVNEGRDLQTEQKLLEKKTGNKLFRKKGPFTAEELALRKRIKDNATESKAAAAGLLTNKRVIYDRVRKQLEAKRAERGAALSKAQKRLAQAKRNLEKGYIDQKTYARIEREAQRDIREARPEPMRYREGEGKAEGISLEEMQGAVDAALQGIRLPIKPKLVQSVADLPADIRSQLEVDDRLDAFGFLSGKDVYLIADNMHSVDSVMPTLFHEVLGHTGLQKLFRDDLDNVLTSLYEGNSKLKTAADKWLAARPDAYAGDNQIARAVEEVLANASEKGPLAPSKFDKLVKFLRDAVRAIFGTKLKVTDGEMRAILAMAHEAALDGESMAVGSSAIRYSAAEAEERGEAEAEVSDADAESVSAMEKIQRSAADRIDTEEFNQSMRDAFGARGFKRWIKGLRRPRVGNRFTANGGLNTLPTEGMLDYAETLLGGPNPIVQNMREAVDNVYRLNGFRATMHQSLNRIVRDIKEFINTHGNNVLGDTMFFGRYYNVDMVALKDGMTPEEVYKTDSIWRQYNKRLTKTPNLTAEKRAYYEGKRAQREGEMREAYAAWGELGKLKGGRELYERVRNMYRDLYIARRQLNRKYIENLKDAGLSEEAVSKMLAAYDEQYQRLNEMEEAPAKEDAHKDYPDVPVGRFHREYFPQRRFGKYWLRMKKTKLGEPILTFYESMDERDAALLSFAEEMGFDIRSADSNNYYDIGNDAQRDLGGDFDQNNASTAFNRALNLISDIDPQNFSEAAKNRLKNDVYQLYLLDSPEGALRKSFIKSKNRLGWSQDIVRIVAASVDEYRSDIARLRYGQSIQKSMQAAKKATESIERPKKALALDFINNLDQRLEMETQPKVESWANRIVPGMNQLAYITFLTAPATAMVQPTAIPIRVAPHLWGKYGMVPTLKALGRYMNVFKNLPRRETDARKSFRIPTLLESSSLKNSARHKDALNRITNEFGLISPLSDFLLSEERTPKTAGASRRAEFMTKVYDAMTYLLDTSEQLTREVAFMAAYDLEYDKLANAGLSADERQTKAIMTAKGVLNYTIGSYASINRPLLMKQNELAKALFLFKQYSVLTTQFFFTNMRSIFGKGRPRAERVAAMKEATGVLGMSFLMGGIVGLPLYSLGMMALQALQDATDDDEDRRERMKQNPLTADSVEAQFRYEWLPQRFGQTTFTGVDGKQHSFADVILNGPVSELSGWNFGSRVSLDFTGLWFRAPKDADTWVGTVNNLLVENIPGASASLNMVAMGEEFSKGEIADGLELGVPAAVRGFVKANRLATEGLRTKSEKIRLRAEDIENSEIIGTMLGFNPTQVAKVQKESRDVLGRSKELQTDKSDLISAYNKAVRRIRNGDADGIQDARKAMADIAEYNQKVGNPHYMITYANLVNSLRGAVAEEKYDISGMGLNQIEAYYVNKLRQNR